MKKANFWMTCLLGVFLVGCSKVVEDKDLQDKLVQQETQVQNYHLTLYYLSFNRMILMTFPNFKAVYSLAFIKDTPRLNAALAPLCKAINFNKSRSGQPQA